MKRPRKLTLLLFPLFLLFGGASLIFDLIYKYPVTYIFDKIVWNNYVSAVFVGLAVLLILKQCSWIKNSYIMSFNQWLAYGFIMALFIFARYGEDWSFLKIEAGNEIVKWHWQPFIYDIKLIDILWLSLLYPLSVIFRSVFSKTYNRVYLWVAKIYGYISEKYKGCVAYFKKEAPQNDNAFFEEDVPLKDSDEKKTRSDIEGQKLKDSEEENAISDEESEQYKKLTDVLVPKLVKQKFGKAFSIGIIGPYGNGKSSFVNHLREEFKDKLKSQRFEVIEFLPAYSHKPEQISTDLFTLLAFKLKKYHGNLNQSMLAYAAKLIELGLNGKKDIQGLLKPADWFAENKSASQAYEDLKEIFTQIDIKTIVIIDDVDRLGKDEIFEVLRIIRNTANFPNTIFLVAYDKDYVAKTIGEDLMYLDKYFQYEMFVPPHRSVELFSAFSEMVLRKETGIDAEKLKAVINVETLNKTLLDKFVFNYRDVKVLTNIYCTNLCLLTEDVDFIDLLHFTLMNRHFPKQVRYLYDNFSEIFMEGSTDRSTIGIAEVRVIKFKEKNILFENFTIDDMINNLRFTDGNKKLLFRRLFVLLFNFNRNGESLQKSVVNQKSAEELVGADKYNLSRVYKPDNRYSIQNYDRTHIYFEILLRNDDISNVEFNSKLGTNKFEEYIDDLLKNNEGEIIGDIRRKLCNKFLELDITFDSEEKIKNTICTCYKVDSSKDRDLIVHVLLRFIFKYDEVLKIVFNNSKEKFTKFFKENLWDNKGIDIEYKIGTILSLYSQVDSTGNRRGSMDDMSYWGSSHSEIREILISKTKEYIKNVDFKYGSSLVCISDVLDSELGVSDADIGFSDYLYSNEGRLFEYLKVVGSDYNIFKFSSAIFKVFTDINKFEKECVDKFPDDKLIREFHHLLELHDLRKDNEYLSRFTPFYFNIMKENHAEVSDYQTIYVKVNGQQSVKDVIDGDHPDNQIEIYKIKDSISIIEGKHSYLTLIEKRLPNFKYSSIVDYLKANKDKFEILSIQTPVYIDKSIIPYSKYNKMIEELKVAEN
ncbi:MAG: AAA family ATPase [Marinifilaceae bacterium]|nr:AAA family ATPase [Marinifilaceae bacterium]